MSDTHRPTPTFTESEERFYDALINNAANVIGVPVYIEDGWLRNDERSRLMWYFIAKKLELHFDDHFGALQDGLRLWENDKDIQPFWCHAWGRVLEQIQQGHFDVLYERSERMQQLRSHPLPSTPKLDDKLRYKIITTIARRCRPR